jgi:hypothetical protein
MLYRQSDEVRRRCAALNLLVAGHAGGGDTDAVLQARILCHSLRGLLKDHESQREIASIEGHAAVYLSGEQEGPFARLQIARQIALFEARLGRGLRAGRSAAA